MKLTYTKTTLTAPDGNTIKFIVHDGLENSYGVSATFYELEKVVNASTGWCVKFEDTEEGTDNNE